MRRPTLFFISFPEGQPQKRSSPSTKPTINPETCKCVTNPQIFSALFLVLPQGSMQSAPSANL